MKIATYNVNGVNGRLAVLLRWLKEAQPDIVCLQELKCADREFPARQLTQAGYHAVWCCDKAWNGVAILSRKGEPVVTRTALPGDPEPGGAADAGSDGESDAGADAGVEDAGTDAGADAGTDGGTDAAVDAGQ